MSKQVELFQSFELGQAEWRDLQSLQRDAFIASIGRDHAEIDSLVLWDNPKRYYMSHLEPNTEVGKQFNANQLYTHPKVAVMTDAGEPIGFAYSALNVSGETDTIRAIKLVSVVKNYFWLREVAVKPEHQQQGVATTLGKTLLQSELGFHPVATYIWPDEVVFLPEVLKKLGFASTGEQQVRPFGEQSASIRQVRMQAPTIRSVLRKLV